MLIKEEEVIPLEKNVKYVEIKEIGSTQFSVLFFYKPIIKCI